MTHRWRIAIAVLGVCGAMLAGAAAQAKDTGCTRGTPLAELTDARMASLSVRKRDQECQFSGTGTSIAVALRQSMLLTALAGRCPGTKLELQQGRPERFTLRVPAACLAAAAPKADAPFEWRPATAPAPHYPTAAWQQGLKGTTTTLVAIDGKGSVRGGIVTASSGHDILDAAALEAVARWTFATSRADPPAVSLVRIPFDFDF